mmetsp:Transcript_27401/g.59930  ORF Transcript_27401/g.59930 Transcript_27401/m.59930 type:complete len:660 (+) Transcript_27401:81-2060(+)
METGTSSLPTAEHLPAPSADTKTMWKQAFDTILGPRDTNEAMASVLADNQVTVENCRVPGYRLDAVMASIRSNLERVGSSLAPLGLFAAYEAAVTHHLSHQAAPVGQAQGVRAPSSKKIKITGSPSAILPQQAEQQGLIPNPRIRVRQTVVFYTGRGGAAPVNTAPPVLLCVPEFGLLHDIMSTDPDYAVRPKDTDYEAAQELCKIMNGVYLKEDDRQSAFVTWYEKYMPEPPIDVPRKGSSTAKETGANDGEVVIQLGGRPYLLALLEAKNEIDSSGDPMFQSLRYYQCRFQDGELWDSDLLLRASGAPSLVLEVVGPLLCISGVYTLEGNVVVREPLTPWMHLLPLHERMEAHTVQLASALCAYKAAVQLLAYRLNCMSTEHAWDFSSEGQDILQDMQLSPHAVESLEAALTEATLIGPAKEAAAAVPAKAAVFRPASHTGAMDNRPWTRLPYCLANITMYTEVASLRRLALKPIFSAVRMRDGRRVLLKCVQHPYPEKVHHAWAAAGVSPQLLEVRRLPGGWWMVVQELLGVEWRTYQELNRREKPAAYASVEAAVLKAHGTLVTQAAAEGEEDYAAHGDLRPPNVMIRKGETGSWDVRLVDLDWAGIVGRAVYPNPFMSPNIPWHHDAKVGKVLQHEHDLHLLHKLFAMPVSSAA